MLAPTSNKVSIIIPVYNVEPYLHECLDHVIHQTLKEIEIICVNDASTDNSLNVLKEYAERDSRIQILDQKVNNGLSISRNIGANCAVGEYIYFLDSDDFIELNTMEKLYNHAKSYMVDVVVFDG